jgi:hypothetical protein
MDLVNGSGRASREEPVDFLKHKASHITLGFVCVCVWFVLLFVFFLMFFRLDLPM